MMINIDDLTNKNIFAYVVVSVILLFIFSTMNIGINILFGGLICYIIVLHMAKRDETQQAKLNDEYIDKVKMIKPRMTNSANYSEIVDYYISTQDIYKYNPLAYEEMMHNIDVFFEHYEECLKNSYVASERYTDMRLCKINALNALQSIIHTINTDVVSNELNNYMYQLENALNTYLDKTELIYNNHIAQHGYDVNIRPIYKDWLPMNIFEDTIFGSLGTNMNSYNFY